MDRTPRTIQRRLESNEMATKKNATQTAEQSAKTAKPAKASETPKPAAKPAKPEVSQLEKVVESQSNPTMWQYARLAKFAVARMEAGQPLEVALDAVIRQATDIVRGILAQNPASAKDADVDGATKAFFATYAAKSLTRERGPKASGEGETEGTTGK